jgi:hypothetical protein
MARSGSKNFTYTRNDIIKAALRKIGEYDPGESPGADEVADAAFALNGLIQDFIVEGADIWLREELTLFVQKGQALYSVGPSGDHVTSSYGETTLSADEASGETVLSVTSVTGMVVGDYIGVKIDDGSIHWSTISSIGASTVTIASATDGAASSGNKVYFYTTKSFRPHSVLSDAIVRRSTSGIDSSITLVGEEEYYTLSDKDQSGVPTLAFYKATLDSGSMRLWPAGDGTDDKVVFIANYYPDDFDAASDNADFPVEWCNALIWGLAAELAPEYGVSERRIMYIEKKAAQKLQGVLDFDVENAPVQFEADIGAA